MRTAIAIDDELLRKAVEVADPGINEAEIVRANPVRRSLLESDRVLCHPLIVLALTCGSRSAPRERMLSDLQMLRQGMVATTDEVLPLIENERLYDNGCGAVDIALLASVLMTPERSAMDSRPQS